MRIYHRDEVEKNLIDRIKLDKNPATIQLRDEVFKGVPGNTIGVYTTGVSDEWCVLMFAESTHPDEPIPHWRRLDTKMTMALRAATCLLPFIPVQCCVNLREFRAMGNSADATRVAEAAYEKDATHIYILPQTGLIAVNKATVVSAMGITSLNGKIMMQKIYSMWQLKQGGG